MSGSGDGEAAPARHGRPTGFGVAITTLVVVQAVATQNADSRYMTVGAPALWPTLVVALVVVLGLLAAIVWLRPGLDPDGVALVIAGVGFCFFRFEYLFVDLLPGRSALLAIATFLAVVVGLGWLLWRFRSGERFRAYVLLFLVLYTIAPLAQLVVYRWGLRGAASIAVVDPLPPPSPVAAPPDVYWFVFDEHGSPASLEEQLGISQEAFVSDLEDLGFVVFDDPWASYVRTTLSLSSTLSMDYVVLPGNDLRNEIGAPVEVLQEDNATVRRFRELGYEVVYAPSGMLPWSACGSAADRCIGFEDGLRQFDEVTQRFVNRTPLRYLDPLPTRSHLPTVLDEVEASSADAPRFVFAHVMSPHDPYRYEADCSLRATDLPSTALTVELGKQAYAQDLACLDAEILDAVARIVAADPDAVIVLQGDHGTRFQFDLLAGPGQTDVAQLTERLAPLNAIRAPEGCIPDDPRAALLVNTFRVVFACVEGTEPELLDFRAFMAGYDRVDDLVELDTGQLGG